MSERHDDNLIENWPAISFNVLRNMDKNILLQDDVNCRETFEDQEDTNQQNILEMLDASEKQELYNSVTHVKNRYDCCTYYVINEVPAKCAYTEKQKYGLFLLIISYSFTDCIRTWINQEISKTAFPQGLLLKHEKMHIKDLKLQLQ